MFTPVIMAGGSGSRLWPLSRSMFPKQFLSLDSKSKLTMLQATIERIEDISNQAPIIITNEQHRFIVAEQLREYGKKSRIILEPAGRNTAPAIAIAAFEAIKYDEDSILLVLAADHVVTDKLAFQSSVLKAEQQAKNDYLVTFGIIPTTPETGYGYIHRGDNIENNGYKVTKFVEKPDFDTALSYVNSGEYYWNSGCFMFKASSYLAELKKYSPEIYQACERAIKHTAKDIDFIRVNKEEFLKSPDDSVDYAVMEKTDKVVVVPMDAGWSDVGSWSALWDVSEKDENHNVCHGDVIMENTSNCYLYSPNKLVAAVGLDNIIVVDTKDAVLVADKSKVQEVKKIVEQLKNEKRKEYKEHKEIYYPWGRYDTIAQKSSYVVCHITINPEQSENAQIYSHYAKHWIIISGTAKLTKDGETFLVTKNQSIYIPEGVQYKVENPLKIPLEVIEIRSSEH